MLRFFKQFSFPGGIGSHCTPETRDRSTKGANWIRAVSCVWGCVRQSRPDRRRGGRGWRIRNWTARNLMAVSKFLNPIRDGAVLPILHLNGYKINNPTLLARFPTKS